MRGWIVNMRHLSKKKIIIIVCVLILGSLISFLDHKHRQKVYRLCKDAVTEICEEYDIQNLEIFTAFDRYWDFDYYTIYVKGNLYSLKHSEIYSYVRELEEIEVDAFRTEIGARIILNGDVYSTRGRNNCDLVCNNDVVYTHLTEVEKVRRSYLKDGLPYEGMAEKDISLTKLGEPDEIEYSHDYEKRMEKARHITYIWYNSEGQTIAKASVKRWNAQKREVCPGYVFYVDIAEKFID